MLTMGPMKFLCCFVVLLLLSFQAPGFSASLQSQDLKTLESSLASDSAEMRWQALQDLEQYQGQGIPLLISALDHADARVRSEVPYRLAQLGVPAELALLQAIKKGDTASESFLALGLLFLQDMDCGQASAKMMGRAGLDLETCANLSFALQLAIGPKAEWVQEGLGNDSAKVRRLCSQVVCGDERPAALKDLERLLGSDDPALFVPAARGG